MQVVDIVLGVTSFFTIALGGLCVGMLLGLVTALITRFTKEVRQGVDISTYLHIYHHIYSGAGGGAPGHPLPGLHCLHDGGAAHLVWHHQHDRYLALIIIVLGLLALYYTGCGIVQSHYAFKNISEKSHITIHYFVSMLRSGSSDMISGLMLTIITSASKRSIRRFVIISYHIIRDGRL